MINESRFTQLNWRYWTRGAVECYNRSCICQDCPISKILSPGCCRMKYAVISLVRTSGLPPQPRDWEEENKLVEKIALGIEKGFNLKEIAQQLDKNYIKIQRLARAHGLDTTRNRVNWRKDINGSKSRKNKT